MDVLQSLMSVSVRDAVWLFLGMALSVEIALVSTWNEWDEDPFSHHVMAVGIGGLCVVLGVVAAILPK